MDLAHPLPQGEEVQVFIVETGVALGQPQHKAGQGPENEQGTYRTQGQHGHTELRAGQNHHAEGEQHDIGHSQAHHTQHTLEHRPLEGPLPQGLVAPVPLHQVQQLGAGYLHAAEQHHQQENKAKVQDGLACRRRGEVQAQHAVHGDLEHGQGELGQPQGGQHAQPQTQHQRHQGHQPGLQHQHQGHLPLAKTQQEVSTQLPLAPPQQKAVGVENEAGQHHRHKDGEDADAGLDHLHHGAAVLGQIDHSALALQGVKGVEETHAEGEGEQIHPVVPEGPAHVAKSQLKEHLPSLLPAG